MLSRSKINKSVLLFPNVYLALCFLDGQIPVEAHNDRNITKLTNSPTPRLHHYHLIKYSNINFNTNVHIHCLRMGRHGKGLLHNLPQFQKLKLAIPLILIYISVSNLHYSILPVVEGFGVSVFKQCKALTLQADVFNVLISKRITNVITRPITCVRPQYLNAFRLAYTQLSSYT